MLFRDLAKLSKDAALMYHVAVRSKNKKTNQFFKRIDVLAYEAGLNHYSAVYAIKELKDNGILSRKTRPGHSSIYTLLQELPLSEPKEKATTRPVAQGYHPPVAQGYHITTDFNINNLTTTDWLSENLSKTLISQYGSQAVEDRVVVISKMNGKIQNKAGLLVASLKGGYIPDSKELREKEKSIAKEKLIAERIEKDRLEREETERAYAESVLTHEQIREMIDRIGKEKGN